jgi:hypothetical protein
MEIRLTIAATDALLNRLDAILRVWGVKENEPASRKVAALRTIGTPGTRETSGTFGTRVATMGEATGLQPVSGDAPEDAATAGDADEDAATETTAKGWTTEEVRKAAHEKAKAGKRAEVKALIASMGAASLADIPAAKYGVFMAELGAL